MLVYKRVCKSSETIPNRWKLGLAKAATAAQKSSCTFLTKHNDQEMPRYSTDSVLSGLGQTFYDSKKIPCRSLPGYYQVITRSLPFIIPFIARSLQELCIAHLKKMGWSNILADHLPGSMVVGIDQADTSRIFVHGFFGV